MSVENYPTLFYANGNKIYLEIAFTCWMSAKQSFSTEPQCL